MFFMEHRAVQEESLSLLEEVVEYRGRYVAAYVIRADEGFIGMAKLCMTEPESAWDTPDAVVKLCTNVRMTARDALIHARLGAFECIDGTIY